MDLQKEMVGLKQTRRNKVTCYPSVVVIFCGFMLFFVFCWF